MGWRFVISEQTDCRRAFTAWASLLWISSHGREIPSLEATEEAQG